MNIQNLELWMIAIFQLLMVVCTCGLVRVTKSLGNDSINHIENLHNDIERLRVDLDGKFDIVNQYLAENHENIQDIKERLTFLEAYNSFSMAIRPYEPVQPNPRSEAAREMWKRRKQKSLDKKE
jgi:hypothetical protein